MKTMFMIIAIIAMIAISAGHVATPLDALNAAGKEENIVKIDTSGVSREVFNSSAFTKDNVMQGKHFAAENDAFSDALASEKSNSEWMNKTIELVSSLNGGYGNKTPETLSGKFDYNGFGITPAYNSSVDEFIASLR